MLSLGLWRKSPTGLCSPQDAAQDHPRSQAPPSSWVFQPKQRVPASLLVSLSPESDILQVLQCGYLGSLLNKISNELDKTCVYLHAVDWR